MGTAQSSPNSTDNAAHDGSCANSDHRHACNCWLPHGKAHRREVICFPLNSRVEWIATPNAQPHQAAPGCNCSAVWPIAGDASDKCGCRDACCRVPPTEFFADTMSTHGASTSFWRDPVELRGMLIAVFGIVLLENAVFAGLFVHALINRGN